MLDFIIYSMIFIFKEGDRHAKEKKRSQAAYTRVYPYTWVLRVPI